jgi:tetratricopeptide (TPR) repeat protein
MAGKWRRIAAALATAMVMAGCAHVMAYNQAIESEKAGDYVQAANKTVEAIGHVRDYAEARQLWPRLWPTASAHYLQRIATAETNQDWVDAVASLEALGSLHQRAVDLGLDAPLEPIAQRLANARDRAADAWYRTGLSHEQKGNLREAAIAYRNCLNYVKDFRDGEARYAKTRAAAMVRVAVLPFDNASYWTSASNLLGDKLIQDLLGKQGEFLSFVDRKYLDTVIKEGSLQASGLVDPTTAVRLGKLAGIRYLVVGRVTQVSATTPTDSREQYTATRLITDQNQQYNVSATYTLWRQVREVLLTASVQIIDVVDGTVIQAYTETERAADTAESIHNLVGDLRALDSTQQHKYYAAPNLKSHDTLLNEATTSLSKVFAGRIASRLN